MDQVRLMLLGHHDLEFHESGVIISSNRPHLIEAAPTETSTSFRDGLQAQNILDAVLESDKKRKWITIP